MSVKKKKITHSVNTFIDKGADVKESKEKKMSQNILVRVPKAMLMKVDGLVKEGPWANRTQWVVEAIYEKLKSAINEERKDVGEGN